MAQKSQQVVGFATINKNQIKGRVKHSRTGACTAKGRCNHGMKPRLIVRGKSSSKSKIGKA